MKTLEELRELIIKANYGEHLDFSKEVGNNMIEIECGRWANINEMSITLAEVLLALRQTQPVVFEGSQRFEVVIDDHQLKKQELQISFDYLGMGIYQYIYWDLTKDLDNQSPETIGSLLKLLKGE